MVVKTGWLKSLRNKIFLKLDTVGIMAIESNLKSKKRQTDSFLFAHTVLNEFLGVLIKKS